MWKKLIVEHSNNTAHNFQEAINYLNFLFITTLKGWSIISEICHRKKMSIFSKLLDYYRKLKKKIEGRKYFYFQIFHSPYENFCKVRCLCYLSVIDLHKFCIVIVLENFATSEIPFECSIHYLKQFGDFCYLRRKWLKGWGR